MKHYWCIIINWSLYITALCREYVPAAWLVTIDADPEHLAGGSSVRQVSPL